MKVLVIEAWGASFVRHQIEFLRERHEVNHIKLPVQHGPKFFVAACAVAYALFARIPRPDLVHSYSAWPSGIAGALLAFWWRVPHVVHEHLSPASRLSSLPFSKQVLGSATRVVSPSRSHAKDVEMISGRPVCVVPNPVVVGTPVPHRPAKAKSVVMVGRLEEQKGFHKMVKVAENMPEVSFFVIGDGSLKRWFFYAAPSNMYMRSSCDHKTAMSWIAGADVVVCPSEHESFGLVAAEACKLGKKVVATDVGAHRDYASVLVDKDSSATVLEDAVRTALYDPSSPKEYREQTTSFVEAIGSIYATPSWASLL